MKRISIHLRPLLCGGMVLVAALLAGPSPRACPAASDAISWKTGASFQRQLRTPVGITWSSNPLRRALDSLARNQRVAIVLDRRVDPDQKVDFSAADVPLGELIARIARRVEQRVCFLGSVVYVGPPEVVASLSTLTAIRREEVGKLPEPVRERLTRLRSWQWDELTTPRDLIRQLVDEAELKLYATKDDIPHDLWPAGDLPPMGFVERMTLVTAGFDRTFEFSPDGRAVRLVPLPKNLAVERRYLIEPRARSIVAQLPGRFPDAKFRTVGNQLVVRARFEQHDAIAELLRGQSKASDDRPGGRKVYTVKVDNIPAGALMKNLGKQLGLKVEFDPRAAGKLGRMVSFNLKEVSRDELFKAVLDPAGLTYTIEGETILVAPK